jgi:LAO/AO transport system kinase
MIDILKLKSGDRRTLAKAITLIESTKESDQFLSRDLLNTVLGSAKKSFRLGISGSPGVGKSTFIEQLGLFLISRNHKVAVLAVDPSSPTSGGSILGDKTRMEKLANEENAFIRPSPASGTLGGVAQKTREAILLCEVSGFDFVIIETVGVGQSEYEVSSMVDFFLLMILPSAGDELQGIKKGILELADTILINKADGDNLNLAIQTQAQYQSALHITSTASFWKTEVILNSSLSKDQIEPLYKMMMSYKDLADKNQYWDAKRQKQNLDWFDDLIKEIILNKIRTHQKTSKQYNELMEKVKKQKISPIEAAFEVAKSLAKD